MHLTLSLTILTLLKDRFLTDFGTLRALPNQSDQYQYLYASAVSHGRTYLLCTMAELTVSTIVQINNH